MIQTYNWRTHIGYTPVLQYPVEDHMENLIKSKERVSKYGEVYTPSWMINDMVQLVQMEVDRIDSRFLEPACGSGNFLVDILSRKISLVEERYGRDTFEKAHFLLLALMSIYGVELLEDNAQECRKNLSSLIIDSFGGERIANWKLAVERITELNIVQGDALTMTTQEGTPLTFPEWSYLGKGLFQRRDFQFQVLTLRAGIKGTLFEELKDSEIFKPTQIFKKQSITEIAKNGTN